ncbi:hypothetical protein BGZ46_001136 [Entomortierella lignicola]|nr:hypothetical protein BGZ46_001136 [Entomortierella lignicola]
MQTKFDSTYFAAKKNQTLGPQDRSFAWADENSNNFYVTYISGVSSDGKTSYYEFASYKDLPTFLKAYNRIPDKEKCFNEQIREGTACSEYYDIDWALKSPVEDPEKIVQLEQRVFEEFLQQRNQHAPEYPVLEDQCRVLSSSSRSKVSLHIVIPTYTFENNNQHMLKFMQDFKAARSNQDQDENSLGDHIDIGVYTKSRGIRCLGSCKRNDMSRRFIRAPWHRSSVYASDMEFFITNVRADSTKVVCQTMAIRNLQHQPNSIPLTSTTPKYTTPRDTAIDTTLPPQLSLSAVFDAYLHSDEMYASPYIEYHKSSMSLLIRSETGTGKTTFLEKFIQRNPKLTYLAISPRQTLAFSLEERLGFKSYLDFPSTYIRGQKIVIQAESLHKLDLAYYTMDLVLILDEVSSIFDQMTSVTTMRGFHKVNNDILRDFIKVSKKVIALDADLTDRDVQVVKELRDDVHVIHNTFKPQQGDLVSLYENEAALKLKVINLVKSGKKVWICSTQKAEDAEGLHAELKAMGFIGMCITANSLELEKRTSAQGINKIAPTLDYFIHTPTITVGLDCNVPHFDYVVGFFMSQSKVTVETCRQMLRRVRRVQQKEYLIYISNSTSNLPTTHDEIVKYLCSQEVQIKGCTLDTNGFPFDLRVGQDPGVKHDVGDIYYTIFINALVKKHLSMNDFIQRFITQMVQIGCSVVGLFDQPKDPKITKSLKRRAGALLKTKYTGISEAEVIDYEELLRLEARSNLSTEEYYAVQKFKIMDAYSIEDPYVLTPEWVETYSDPKEMKVFQNLQALRNDPELRMVKQNDSYPLGKDQERRDTGAVLHRLHQSKYTKLKYAKDILSACGYDSPFDPKYIASTDLKSNLDEQWESLSLNMRNICTQLQIPYPRHNNWDFRKKQNHINSVLNEVLGIHIVGTNKKATAYHIKYMRNVGKNWEDFFNDGAK